MKNLTVGTLVQMFLRCATIRPMARGRPTLISALRGSLPRKGRLLVAASGGADSMALLHGVLSLRKSLQLSVGAAHIDHSLRRGSEEGTAFVRAFAEANDSSFHTEKLRAPPKINIEAWARRERYRALSRLRDEGGFDWILTAHTANDVAETLVMRLVANKEPASIDTVDRKRKLLRPLLEVTRSEVVAYLNTNGVGYIEDPSNLSQKFLRNRVRHQILPRFIEEFGDGVIRSLALEGQRLHKDIAVLRKIGRAGISKLDGVPFGSKEWLRALTAQLKKMSKPLQLRLLEALFNPELPYRLGVRHTERLLRFILDGKVGVELPEGVRVRRKGGGIEFGNLKSAKS